MRSVGFVVTLALTISACAGTEADKRPSSSSGTAGAGGSTSIIGTAGTAGSSLLGGIDASLPPLHGAVKSDGGDTLTVSGMPTSDQFHVVLDDGSMPHVVWSVDDTRIGSIGADGVFHANGYVGGKVTVTAATPTGMASLTITVNVDITENPAAVSDGDKGSAHHRRHFGSGVQVALPLRQDGLSARPCGPDLAIRRNRRDHDVPQDHRTVVQLPTVRRRRLADPSHHFRPGVEGRNVDRRRNRQGNRRGHQAVRRSSCGSGNRVLGHCASKPEGHRLLRHLQVAASAERRHHAHSPRPDRRGRSGGVHGVPYREREWQRACGGIRQRADERGDWNPVDSASYDLSAAGTATQRTKSTEGRLFSFAALTPDGKLGLVQGLPPKRWPPFIARGVSASLGVQSKLVDTATGLDVAAPSLGSLVQYATSPTFSPMVRTLRSPTGIGWTRSASIPSARHTCLASCKRVLSLARLRRQDVAAYVLEFARRGHPGRRRQGRRLAHVFAGRERCPLSRGRFFRLLRLQRGGAGQRPGSTARRAPARRGQGQDDQAAQRDQRPHGCRRSYLPFGTPKKVA